MLQVGLLHQKSISGFGGVTLCTSFLHKKNTCDSK